MEEREEGMKEREGRKAGKESKHLVLCFFSSSQSIRVELIELLLNVSSLREVLRKSQKKNEK